MSRKHLDGRVAIKILEGSLGKDEESDPRIAIVIPNRSATDPRTESELRESIRELSVSSVEDFCSQASLSAEADVEDVDGNPVHLSIPIENENTFSIDGLTRQNEFLMENYIYYLTFEHMERFLDERGADSLSEEDISYLEGQLRLVSEAIEEVDR